MKNKTSPHFLIAMDSFKGSASSLEVADCVKDGLLRVEPLAKADILPIADGGEGTVEALVKGLRGSFETVSVSGPLGQKVTARYGIINGNQAVMEMAEASGLTLVQSAERNPFMASSYGTGEMILAALKKGIRRIYIGIGGSATNDGGAGMAQALGISLLDKNGKEIPRGAQGLPALAQIRTETLDPRVLEAEIRVLSDVNNPLCGEHGASRIFGVQKGASLQDCLKLDEILCHWAEMVRAATGADFADHRGSGAAGGLGFALLAFCGAKIQPGIESILDLIHIEEYLPNIDCVITGEGRMDNQSVFGKAPIGVARRAKKYNLPVIAIVGSRALNLDEAYKAGVDLVIDLIHEPMTLQQAMQQTPQLARLAGENALKAYTLRN
ncbi:MAG: glycerate kinase [Anaerolineaceae bacterium]|nr:glycerate kinase [Anaerolineaceae bacterium]